ncbi:MAG: hypothetical protein ACNA8L_03495 [Luteolibacter sp.]
MPISLTKLLLLPAIGFSLIAGIASARPRNAPQLPPLTAEGEKHLERYAAMLESVKGEVKTALPAVDSGLQAALDQAHEAVVVAKTAADEAQKNLGSIGAARGLVAHATGKWIGGADKGIARAEQNLKNAKTDAEREAARKDLANWQKNREEGMAALKERQAKLDEALKNEEKFKRENAAAQAALTNARDAETAASKKLIESLASVLGNDALDATLAKGAVLASAGPEKLARFAESAPGNAAVIDQLLSDAGLMKEMLAAGGAAFGEWGNAAAIFAKIQKASPRASEGLFRRLAIGTSVVHARPIGQSKPKEPADLPTLDVDPVQRYLHYEKAYLAGELDPAFEHLAAWEYRNVVNSDAPDEMLQWGRTMLRNYRPDHIYNPDYGWRYVSSVRSEVPYGSQNVKYDIPTLHQYQNIVLNGGICGRRAFYGRFILRAFGIPTWGVTQRAHAAVGHWTPKGWVTVLGAGFHASWWDKDDTPMSGSHFLLDSQARADAEGYLKVLRAQWISRVLGEQAYNDRRKVAGGFWSRAGLYQQRIIAASAQTLGPLGQELAEANEREQQLRSAAVASADKEVRIENGVMIIPSVGHAKSSGKSAAMKSFGDGMQIHMLGGFKADYVIEVPEAGKYQIMGNVATLQKGQKLIISSNGGTAPTEIDVPYTIGMWEYTEPVTLDLKAGENTIHVELKNGSRGVTVKDFMLRAAK